MFGSLSVRQEIVPRCEQLPPGGLSDLEEALRAVKGKSTMVRTRKLSPNGDGSVSVIVLKKD